MTIATETDGAASLMPLTLLRAGQAGRVGEVVGGSALAHRLCELGLCAGAEVQMVRPGRPCLLRLQGRTLCVRADELSGVLVCPAARCPLAAAVVR